MSNTSERDGWIFAALLLGPIVGFFVYANLTDSEPEPEPEPIRIERHIPTFRLVHAPDAAPTDFAMTALVDGELWPECSLTSDVPPCWVEHDLSFILYWPDGSAQRI